jgi:uncharacterized membrane protein
MTDRTAQNLAKFLATAGVTHFVAPSFYDRIVPHVLPGPPRFWTQLSGAAELAVAATVAFRPTRRTGGALAAALFVAVFPGNLQMAWDYRHRSKAERAVAYGRLPLQIPMVVWALRVRADAA